MGLLLHPEEGRGLIIECEFLFTSRWSYNGEGGGGGRRAYKKGGKGELLSGSLRYFQKQKEL